jgi:hypothetical protein
MGSMDKLFAMGQGPASAPGDEKPAVVISAPMLALGINATGKANGIDNLNSQGLTGKDIFKSPEEGGQAIMQWSSKPKEGNFIQKAMKAAHADLQKMNNESFPTGSNGGGGSSGGGGEFRGGAGDASLAAVVANLTLHPMPLSGGVSVVSAPTAPSAAPSAPAASASMEV